VLELYSLRFQLSHLEIINSGIFSVSQLLGPEKWDRSVAAACLPMQLPIVSSTISSQQAQLGIPDAMQWRQLTVLRMSNCAIDRLDRGMHLLPRLEQLDLSYNDIAHVVHLQDCRNLRVLNVSHNRIRVLSNLNRVIRGIRKLNLAFNCIESLDGLGSLDLLEW
jgi:Leucine-rich repeat (LRR) protein